MELLNPLNGSQYAGQSVAYTGTANTISTSFPPGPDGVVVWASTACYVAVGESPTATSADLPIPANTMIPIKLPQELVTKGCPFKVSAIQVSSSGTLYVKPIAKL